VRLTVFWEKMRGQFGEAYAASVAKDYVLADLGGATVTRPLPRGRNRKTCGWRCVRPSRYRRKRAEAITARVPGP